MNVSGDYCELAILPRELRAVAKQLASSLQISTQPDFILGLAPGGIPITVALGYELEIPTVIAYKCRLDIPSEITWVEPHCVNSTFYLYGATAGMSVLLLDDEVDSGHTLCNAVQSLERHGIQIVDVGCVVEILHCGRSIGRDRLRELGLSLKSMYRMEVENVESKKYIS
jgi:adenine/guanine phosphoribosyltransferase-like PRPP-binding protein